MDKLYWPYSDAFRNLVTEQLDQFGSCLIIDGHSFPSKALPYEDEKLIRPDLCFGYEPFHEPNGLLDSFEVVSSREGLKTARNQPFSGSYVPADFFLKERRVKSIMIEINRSLYVNETKGVKSAHYDRLAATLGRLLGLACSYQI
jgi:N-formylglutamate amidohydrolase